MKLRKYFVLTLLLAVIAGAQTLLPAYAQGGSLSTSGVSIQKSQFFDLFDLGLDELENHWVRYNGLKWSEVEQTRGVYNWSSYHIRVIEDYVRAMNAAGMEVVLSVRSTPGWALDPGEADCKPMKRSYINDFANFVLAAANHFNSGTDYHVRFIEIWNEPDSPLVNKAYGCWGDPSKPYGGGEYYGQVLNAVYEKIQSKGPGDVKIVIGGLLLGFDPRENWDGPEKWKVNARATYQNFFEGILRGCDHQACFDYVNFHAYNFYDTTYASAIEMEKFSKVNWMASGGQVEGKLAYLREMMEKYGYRDKPIVLTEAALLDYDVRAETTHEGGEVGDYDPVFEAEKADYLVWLYTRNLAVGIDATYWFTFDEYGWMQSGLLKRAADVDDPAELPLPAYHAFNGVTRALAGLSRSHLVRELDPVLGLLGFEFQRDDGSYLWVLFPSLGGTRTLRVAAGNQVYNHNYQPLNLTEGQSHPFDRPVYVEFDHIDAQPQILVFNFFIPFSCK